MQIPQSRAAPAESSSKIELPSPVEILGNSAAMAAIPPTKPRELEKASLPRSKVKKMIPIKRGSEPAPIGPDTLPLIISKRATVSIRTILPSWSREARETPEATMDSECPETTAG